MSINITSLTIKGNKLVSRLVLDGNYKVRLPVSSSAFEFINDGKKVDLPLVSYKVPAYPGDTVVEVAVPYSYENGVFKTEDAINVEKNETIFLTLTDENKLVKIHNLATILDIAAVYNSNDKEEPLCLGTWYDNQYDELPLVQENSHMFNVPMLQKLFKVTNNVLNPNSFYCYNANGALTTEFISKVEENFKNPEEVTLVQFEELFEKADNATHCPRPDLVGKTVALISYKDFGDNALPTETIYGRNFIDEIKFYKIVEPKEVVIDEPEPTIVEG